MTGDAGADITVNVDAALSKDSGTFVGIFGIIEAEWKDMLGQWLEDDGDAGDITPQQVDEGLVRGDILAPTDPTDRGTNVILVPVVGSTTGATFERLTNTYILNTAENEGQAGASATCVCIVDSNADGVINIHDFRVEYNRARGSGGVLKSVTYSVNGASVSLEVVIDGTTVTVAR